MATRELCHSSIMINIDILVGHLVKQLMLSFFLGGQSHIKTHWIAIADKMQTTNNIKTWFEFIEMVRISTLKSENKLTWGRSAGSKNPNYTNNMGDKVKWGSMTCNDFLLEGLWHENVWAPLLYILMIAEQQRVTAWHLCSCDIIKMLIWQHTNYEYGRSDTRKHFALSLSLTWPFTMILRSSSPPVLSCVVPPPSLSLSIFSASIPR